MSSDFIFTRHPASFGCPERARLVAWCPWSVQSVCVQPGRTQMTRGHALCSFKCTPVRHYRFDCTHCTIIGEQCGILQKHVGKILRKGPLHRITLRRESNCAGIKTAAAWRTKVWWLKYGNSTSTNTWVMFAIGKRPSFILISFVFIKEKKREKRKKLATTMLLLINNGKCSRTVL